MGTSAVGEGDRRGLGGVLGPAAFIAAWVLGGALADGYSPVDDAISRLAAVGADTRWLMSGGFVAFTAGMLALAAALRGSVARRAWPAAAVAGLATFAVALTPLDRSPGVDDLHGLAAVVGYVGIAATPLLAARPLLADGHRRLGVAAVVAGSTAAICLVLSAQPSVNGLFQRAGLTSADAWLMACGLALARGRLATAATT